MDHCAESNHGCEHLCLNTDDSYVCQCFEGFVINEDLKTCTRKSSSCSQLTWERFLFSYREEDTPSAEGSDTIQRDLNSLERWTSVKLMKFNKTKHKVLHLGQGNPELEHRLGDELREQPCGEGHGSTGG